ncbi:putative ankyrin repeat protein RBE_0317 isoform X2 [Watersipora subatra]|uniref:putative ankyrin repeat protein RBE_0317 isoform X2 n=1 Tax=Watersipora subatra TaxID=2589382 RepID=UPI00355AFAF7
MTRMTLMDGGNTTNNQVLGLVKAGNSKDLVTILKSSQTLVEDLNTPDGNGRTCLSFAVYNGDISMVELLLATDIPNPNIADADGNTPLIYAVSLEALLKYDSTNIDQANNNGFTALIKAAIHGHHSCMELLIVAGADADLTDYARGMNAFQWAEHCTSQSCMKTLKKHKLHSTKKSSSHKKTTCREGNEPSSPLRKIKDSLSGANKQTLKNQRGMESVVACVSAPVIPMVIANANPLPNIQMLCEPNLLSSCVVKHNKKPSSITTAPRIEITSDTGECIIPNKHFFTTPPHKHSK